MNLDRFRLWLAQEVWGDLWTGVISESVASAFRVLNEADYSKEGYKKIVAKFGPYQGQQVWWHPQTKEMVPVNAGPSPSQQQPRYNQQQSQPVQQIPAKSPSGNYWVLATSLMADPNNGINAGDNLAVGPYDAQSWRFVKLNKDDGTLGTIGVIPTASIKTLIKSQLDDKGQKIVENKPSLLLKRLMNKPKGSGNGMIPPEKMTPEGKAIEERFAEMMSGDGSGHMVISALAGSGKTTMLRHLATKFGRPGQNWLYLVFNKKNEIEASSSFPKFVTVRTTNGFTGDILDNNNVKPTERIIKHADTEKARLIIDGPQFQSVLQALKIPDPNNIPNAYRTDKTLLSFLKSIKYEFNSEVVKLLGLAKSFAIDPRDESGRNKALEDVMDSYDLNTHLESVKERLEKNSKQEYYNQIISQMMNIPDFLKYDFRSELKSAANWMLEKTMPHGIDQEFKASAGKFKGQSLDLRGMRDFNDDLWFAATHANELDWTKPRKWDVVLADEVQDFNKAQKIMLQKLAETGAKIVVVGDKNQSIYRFRGADATAFDDLSNSVKQWSGGKDVEFGLTKNFRSKKAVLDFVNQKTVVNNLQQGKPSKSEGNVTDREVKYDDAFAELNKEFKHMGEVKQTAFISRTNEPLVHAALKLLTDHIPFVIVGKDIAKELTDHVDRIARISNVWDNNSLRDLTDAIERFRDERKEDWYGQTAKSAQLKQLEETTSAILAAAQQLDENATVKDFKEWLRARLGGVDIENMDSRKRAEFEKQIEEQNPVILTTAHRSKGLEFERVYILRDDQFPHPKAKRQADLDQEENARYVAYTRAMGELHVLDPKGQPGVPDEKG